MKRLKEAIQQWFVALLDHHLPGKTKRLVFLASLCGQLKSSTQVNDNTLHRLNQILQLSEDDDALRLPIHMSPLIWRSRGFEFDPGVLGDPATFQTFGMRVLSRMPFWLRYGDESQMLQDLEQLLRSWQGLGA